MKTSFISYKTTDVPRGAESALHMSEGYVIGETDFECWDRLWKASPSDPEVDGEEWVNFSKKRTPLWQRKRPGPSPYWIFSSIYDLPGMV